MAELRVHSMHVNWYGDTYSVGGGVSDPSGIFFEEDVLNLPDYYTLKPEDRKPHEEDCEFIKVPIQFEGREYEGWITTRKFGKFSPEDIQNLETAFPKYFSDKPTMKLGFFNEDMNMKFDLVQEGITTNFNSQEIIRIMENENLNSDTKCRRLFDRGEEYLSHVQWLCFRHTDTWVQYLVDHNFVTPDFKNSWEENRREAWDRLDEVVDTAEEINNPSGKRTLFLDNSQWPEEEPCTLEQSWNVYVVRGEARGQAKERRAENWFTHIKSSVSYIEDQGITQEKPKKRLGFFDENLNESISRNFTTDDQIREIMENEQLSLEQKSERLFNRSPEHVRMFAMCTFQIPHEVYEYADEHGGSLYHVDTSQIRAVTYDYSVGGATLMVLGNMSEPFDLEESYEYYVLGRSEKYARTNDYTMEPLGWWKYIKACVEVFETAAGYKGKRLGFFDK